MCHGFLLGNSFGTKPLPIAFQFTGSVTIALPHPEPLPSMSNLFDAELAALLGRGLSGDRVTLRSWRGTFDREELREPTERG